MKRLSALIFSTLILLSNSTLFAQETEEKVAPLDGGTIENQFDYIYSTSNNFQEYKVVKLTNLDKLKGNVLDSLVAKREEAEALKVDIRAQKDSISTLNADLQTSLEEKQEALDAKDNFTFFGIGIHKAVYSSIMWLLVGVLAVALGFFSFQYSRSFRKIKKAEKDLLDVQEEFDQHRKNTLERERKMKRELIDAQMGKK
ncbi:hypothetical protein ACFOSV_08040 [Algoriphagus namhaensis]|uniref:tRNA (Guanine-N1)-methyltransferase n=1 Tax=Algoriphagus namhaensis TaxID=915353 RepID=A0ABV8ATF1_9BACT